MANPGFHVAFIGLGNMGSAMATNLVRKGFDVTVWNRTPSRADELVAAGAKLASTIADAARADVVITMVADDSVLEQVVLEGQLLERLPPGAVHVSMSTISVALSARLAAAHANAGQLFVAAPVFGRPEAAAAAKLVITAAGKPNALGICSPLFEALGQRTVVLGEEPQAANLVKLSGNFLIASVIEALGEAIALVGKAGIDRGDRKSVV